MCSSPAGRTPIAITHAIADDLITEAAQALEAEVFDTSGWQDADFMEHLRGYPGLLISMQTPMHADIIEALAPDLRVISSYTAGVENIDLAAAQRLGIAVANSGEAVAGPTAEIALLLMLGTIRCAAPAIERLRTGEWHGLFAHKPVGAELNRKTLGIVGLGGIGREVATRAAAFGMSVLYHNRNKLPIDQARGAEYVPSLEALLARSDVVSLHCPLNDETHEMINARTLSGMKRGAILINTARGGLLNEADVIDALESGLLGGAGLDVYVGEPDINRYFIDSDKVFALPHIGTATPESRRAMERQAIQNLVRYFSGEPMQSELISGR